MLSYIRSNKGEIDSEIAQIQETAREETKANQKASWATLLSNKYRFLLIAGVGVAAFQQFQGANAILLHSFDCRKSNRECGKFSVDVADYSRCYSRARFIAIHHDR